MAGKMDDYGIPASRAVWDTHAFLHEDKFDTWLDLHGMFEFRDICSRVKSWRKEHFHQINSFISADTVCELHHLGISPRDIATCKITSTLTALIVRDALETRFVRCHLKGVVSRRLIETMVRSSEIAVSLQVDHLLSHVDDSISNKYMRDLRSMITKNRAWPPEILSALYLSEDMMYVLRQHKKLYQFDIGKTANQRGKHRAAKNHCIINLPSLNAVIVVTHDLAILTYKTTRYLLDKNLLLELINKSCELFSTLLYAFFQSGASMPISHYRFVCDIVAHFCNKVTRFNRDHSDEVAVGQDNRGYIYLKAIEGLGAAELIRRADKEEWDNTQLMTTLWKSVYDEGLDENECIFQSELYQIFSQGTQAQIAEVLGLVKLAGHPSIEVKKGLMKLYDRTHENIVIDQAAVNNSIAIMTRDIIKNFYLVHKRYPNIQLSDRTLSARVRALFTQRTNLTTPRGLSQFNAITNQQWGTVKFSKNFEFDPVYKQVELLKDKSLGLNRTKCWKLLMQTSDVKSTKGILGNLEERRALLNFLLQREFSNSFLRYLDEYQNTPEWSSAVLDMLVIKLTPKEKEEKPEGRMFGASPQEERNRRIVQEMNVMRFMSRYIPDQLLTPDELTMVKKMYSFRHLHRLYPGHVIVQISFDFSRWNNSMREASIDRPGKEVLDRLFGTQLYGKTMKAYQNSLVYYTDHYVTDYWEGQQGGIEGLNQATWSMIFTAGIKQALERLGCIYQVTVKGDDVRAAIVVGRSDDGVNNLAVIRDNIMNNLQRLCQDMGWSLNPQESFVSLHLICTSKQYQIRDTWMGASNKKMLKAESLANLIFPTTEDIVSSVFSTAHSACAQTTVVLPCFMTAVMVAARILSRDLWKKHLSPQEIAGLLCWPQILGGPGALPLQTFMVRGENDMLSVSVSLLRYMLNNGCVELKRVAGSILGQEHYVDPDKKQFLSDPYAIPLKIPVRPNSVLKAMIREHMRHWVKNEDLRQLLDVQGKDDEERLINLLVSMKPMCPKLMTAIYENSPFYLVQELISKFMMSTTVYLFFQRGANNTLSKTAAHRMLQKLLQAARKRIDYWCRIVKNQEPIKDTLLTVPRTLWSSGPNICSTEISHKIRCNMWGGEIIALTYPSIVDQNILVACNNEVLEDTQWNIQDIVSHICVNYHTALYQTDDASMHYASVTNSTPWLGQQTATKLMMPSLDSDLRSPTITKILNLLMIKRTGFYLGKNFKALIDQLLAAYTTLSLNNLEILMPEGVGGHIAHRTPINSFSMVTMPNTRPNVLQLVDINNETMSIMKSDPTNRTINYAARHFFLAALSTFELQCQINPESLTTRVYWSLFDYDRLSLPAYQPCRYCCAEVEDIMIDVPRDPLLNLSNYATTNMIGTSPQEEKMLRANMISALKGKAKRLLADRSYDPENPINLEIACRKILETEFKISQSNFASAQGAQAIIIPRQDLFDIVSANWIGSTAGLTRFSIKLLQSIPPAVLYRSLFCCAFKFYLSYVGVKSDSYTAAGMTLLQSHWNPIAGVFNRLSLANQFNNISIGCHRVGWINTKLIWSVGSYNDGHQASKEFLAKHDTIYQQLIHGTTELITQVKFFANYEDNETIIDAMESDYQAFLGGLCNRLNTRGRYGRPFDILHDHFLDTLDEDGEDHIRQGLEHLNIVCADLSRQMYDDRRQHNVEADLGEMISLFGPLLDVVVYFMLAFNTGRGVWSHQDLPEDQILLDGYCLFQCPTSVDGMELDFPPFTIGLIENNSMIKTIDGEYGTWTLCLTYHLAYHFMQDPTVDEEVVGNVRRRCHDHLRWLTLMGRRDTVVMSDEQAERQIKQYIKTLDDPDYGDPNLLIPLGHVPAEQSWDHYCDINTDFPHTLVRANPDIVSGDYTKEPGLTQAIADVTPFRPMVELPKNRYVDYTYWITPPTGINWTAPRFLETLHTFRLIPYLQDLGQQALFVCIGDGTGGCSKILLNTCEESEVIYCSLQKKVDSNELVDDASLLQPPYEFQIDMDPKQLIRRLQWKGFYPGNVSEESTRALLKSSINRQGKTPLMYVSDAEFPSSSYADSLVAFYHGFFDLYDAHHDDNTVVIMKLQLRPQKPIVMFLYLLYTSFRHFHIRRSPMARWRIEEVYIVLSSPNRDFRLADMIRKILLKRSHTIPFIILAVQDLMRVIQSVYSQMTLSLHYGMSQTCDISANYRMICRVDAPIRPLILDLDQLVKGNGTAMDHICNWLEHLRLTATTHLQDCKQLLLETAHVDQPRRRRHQMGRLRVVGTIRAPTSKVLSNASSGLIQMFEDCLKAALFMSLVNHIDAHDIHTLPQLMNFNYPSVCDDVFAILEDLIEAGAIQLIDEGSPPSYRFSGKIYHAQDYISDVLRNVYRYCANVHRICHHINLDVEDFNIKAMHYSKPMRIRGQCCVNYSRQICQQLQINTNRLAPHIRIDFDTLAGDQIFLITPNVTIHPILAPPAEFLIYHQRVENHCAELNRRMGVLADNLDNDDDNKE